MPLALSAFGTREEASKAVAAMAAEALARDIAEQRRADLFVSGGSTPEASFRYLSRAAIEWERVTVGLVDERWVPPDHADSNERLVRAHLLREKAGAAGFIPLWTPGDDHLRAADDRCLAYGPHCDSASFVLLGMGADGHTASWFPEMDSLALVTAADQPCPVAAVVAPGARTPRRLTLTGPAVCRAKSAVLLAFGSEKRTKLEAARHADPLNCPVRFAIDGLGHRLNIVWAP
ncbi:MAG: 6-phosphogluconolactonase [Hyphomonas sp.]|uniref:6-phosphogluconolactonase n=1 Tax=Hyphomonas sp. TaxID=87 RepID=UPI00182FB7F3|nr:6-phosphogluconolactonase [Hyphomonas sp.]MBU3920836.1 6-phosphogluconolactonase [Alphaproteobacteria bacterium]MBA3069632.1 6-phosphogluconolactonase [Hyphomonas sp.]MBU4062473.1 6-phosphogluconolactonase [Alphaproteobacteria bacterium]MBU4163824.1 6-phosphogluconolactonase [Alphaproteobacteria bacterium]MBU4569459.1 6-phosphogluconolactonase [Alphaproteobacteria bacterium]